ncbi:MAG: glycerol-3-phosphate dehydrogenase/oxidase [Deltaproteobacteria bacterium]|nr:glycerol-3-phosphate dehydrogenase/oxidase [Deltaproteobacteria bacterium]MBW2444979.1 glycerol-3-phosphate dehydrogenase/oxidase [Deltaproteobacteria bacterium]
MSGVPPRTPPVSSDPFDVLVVGGGINGAGVARDLALRGARVALVEKREFGSGTSWASSGMIHGGLRYLQHDPEVTLHSCVDSGHIQRIAPHLIFRIPFLMPIFPDDPLGAEIVEIGLEMYDRYQPFKGGRPHTRLSTAQARRLEPGLSDRIEGAFTLDEWGIDAARLCAANALDAAERGAFVRTHTELVAFLKDDSGRVCGARVRDRVTGDERRIEARETLNATGPWVARVSELAGAPVRLRPGKGIHVVFERRVSNLAVYAKGIDGRDMFTFPHEQNSMAGTTDDDFYGDLDRLEVTPDEVAYVLQAMERSLPGIREHRIAHAIAGVRPTLYGFGSYEDELSRDYAVFDHGERDGVPGFWTLAGGKLAAYRLMAEDATDQLCAALGIDASCRTHETPLPGGEAPVDPAEVSRRFGVGLPAAIRVGFRHGARASQVLAASVAPPRPVCVCEPVLDAELRHAARAEGLRTLEDACLRVRLGIGACQGAGCGARAAATLANTLDWPADRVGAELARFVDARWRAIAPVLAGDHIAALEVHRAAFLGARGFAGAEEF